MTSSSTQYRNTGGFDIIGSGRTKLETEEQFAIVSEVCKKHGVTAVVIIGGDDSNTNAAVLAEYFAAHNTGVQVIGCPKTIDGDLKNEDIECSFGFDTATKTYSEIIGNIERDANSAKKYWHFVKVMGRSASHVALECALQTQPNICLISEEVAEKKMSLSQIADYIADSVANRAAKGMNFGVAIIPEGVVEFVPEFSVLIQEINELLAGSKADEFNALATWADKYAFIEKGLTKESMEVFAILPQAIQQQLFMERDPARQRTGFPDRVRKAVLRSGKLHKLAEKKGCRHLQRQVQRPASFPGIRRKMRIPVQLRFRLLLLPGLQRVHADPVRLQRIPVQGFQPVQAGQRVDCRRYAHHQDDEHREKTRRG